jgi:SAM-dependent methyltransferase
MMSPPTPMLKLELFVPELAPDFVFDRFVSELALALPTAGLRLDPGPQGRVVSLSPDSGDQEFAQVTEWIRGERIAFTWHPVISEVDPAPVPVLYRFEAVGGGSRITVEYGEWPTITPIKDGDERVGWFASGILPPILRATSPLGFGDWWTDRVARRPTGPKARENYADPMYHRPNFLLILDRLRLTPNDRLLEVGCGGGAFLHDALRSGCRAWAIDHSPDMVQLAREKNREAIDEKRLVIQQADAHHLPFPDNTCTVAVTTGSFGFWDRPGEGLAEIRRVLQPGGRLILFSGTKELRGTPAAPEPVASRIHWYEDEELVALAKSAGFVEVHIDRPKFGGYARAAGLPPEVVAFFESGPPSGQVLEARRARE